MNYGSEFRNKSSSCQERMRRWLMDLATNHRDFQRMDFHNYVNKEITFVGSNDIMMYARGKHTQFKHWLKGAPEIWARLYDQCQNGDSIINSLRMNGRPLSSKQ